MFLVNFLQVVKKLSRFLNVGIFESIFSLKLSFKVKKNCAKYYKKHWKIIKSYFKCVFWLKKRWQKEYLSIYMIDYLCQIEIFLIKVIGVVSHVFYNLIFFKEFLLSLKLLFTILKNSNQFLRYDRSKSRHIIGFYGKKN